MDRLFCMQVFSRIVEHGSFSRAADALGISRSGATGAVAQLEKQLGVRLLNRTTRRLSVTDEGQAYYPHCVRILGEIAEAEESLSGARQEPRGRLRVSVPQSFVDSFFPALTAFMQRYPQLQVEVILADRAVNLVEEGVDCAIRGVEIPEDSGLVARKLSTTRWVTCASADYFSRHGVPAEIAALAAHNCIRFVSQSSGRGRDWLFSVDGDTVSFVPPGTIRLTSFDAVARVALAGGGIAQLPDALVFDAIGNGALQPILTRHIALAPPLMLVYPANRYLTARVRAFRDFFLGVFPPDGWLPEL